MSMRACWTNTHGVDVEITTDFTDQYGSEVDQIAIGLFQDQDGLVIEGADLDDLRDFVKRLGEAVDAYAREHKNEGDECTCRNKGALLPHDPECPISSA